MIEHHQFMPVVWVPAALHRTLGEESLLAQSTCHTAHCRAVSCARRPGPCRACARSSVRRLPLLPGMLGAPSALRTYPSFALPLRPGRPPGIAVLGNLTRFIKISVEGREGSMQKQRLLGPGPRSQ